jgi:hypothetical protein
MSYNPEVKLTESVRVPNAKEMHLGKHVFPLFALVFLYFLDRIQEYVSHFGKSSPYSRKIVLVHMFCDTKWRKLQKLRPTKDMNCFDI